MSDGNTRPEDTRTPMAHAQKLTWGLSMGFDALENVGRAGEVFALRFSLSSCSGYITSWHTSAHFPGGGDGEESLD